MQLTNSKVDYTRNDTGTCLMYMKSVKRQLSSIANQAEKSISRDVFGDSNSKIILQYNGKELKPYEIQK